MIEWKKMASALTVGNACGTHVRLTKPRPWCDGHSPLSTGCPSIGENSMFDIYFI